MRALCFGDLQVEKGATLGHTPLERITEQEEVLRTILTMSREGGYDVVLNAGDIWEHRKPSPDGVLAVVRPLQEHRDADGPPVIGILGNHEAGGVDGATMPHAIGLTGLMHMASTPNVLNVKGTSICCLPWTPISRLLAAGSSTRETVFEDGADLLLQIARNLHEQAPHSPRVLLLHWSVSQTALPNGMPVESIHEVVIPMEGLAEIGYDAIVAGHIHRPQHLGAMQHGIYVGSPMPLDHGEAGCEHGCWILDTDHGFEFVPLESRRFLTLNTLAALPDLEGAFVKVRQVLSEEEAAGFDMAAVRADLEARGAYSVSFEVTVERARRDRGVVLHEDLSPAQQLAAYLDSLSVNGSVGAAMMETAEGYI